MYKWPLFGACGAGACFAMKEGLKDKVFFTCRLVKSSQFSLCYCRKTLFFALLCLKLKGKWSKRIILKFNSKKTTWHCGPEASKRVAFFECVGNGAGPEFKETGCSILGKEKPSCMVYLLWGRKNRLKSFLSRIGIVSII